ncbi:MAG: RNA methyltransferase [Ruminococcaceae bacterium]|nr:RNA methyltransferase [Oscillospiraceae bacterium]
MITDISGSDHKLVKETAALKEKKYRERYGAFVVEGAMSVLWALQSSYSVKSIVISRDFVPPESIKAYFEDVPVYRVPPHVFSKMADTKTPQGILCVCALPPAQCSPTQGLFLYCDNVRDPGNLGSIIRSADALGFDGVLLSPGCVDPFGPKLVRSTMGSLFHITLIGDVDADALRTMQKSGFSLIVSALGQDAVAPEAIGSLQNAVVAVGNEANGVSEATLSAADQIVTIPMAGSAESLNVAAAAAILLYEIAKKGGRL